jgi:hypothetical protein
MRIHKIILAVSLSFIAMKSMSQTGSAETVKYRKFALYAGAGPSYFFNNLQAFKSDVNPFNYEISFRAMWEPQHSFLSLGIETGYYRLYTVNSTKPKAHVSNSSIPIQFIVSMKFSKKLYASWSMGQSFLSSKVSGTDSSQYNFNSSSSSLSDFAATIGYRFVQKERISYAAEFKGYWSSSYANGTIALLFIVGFRL